MVATADTRETLVLGIETSCDETAAAVVARGADGRGRILSNVVRAQWEQHRRYGGVVPEIAARAHVECLDEIVGRGHARGRHRLPPPRRRGGDGRAWPDRRPAGRRDDGQGDRAGARPARWWRSTIWRRTRSPSASPRGCGRPICCCWSRADTPSSSSCTMSAATSGSAPPSTTRWARPSTRPRSCWAWAFRAGPPWSRPRCRAEPDRFALPRPMLGRPEPHFSFAGLKTAVRHQAQALVPLREQDVADLCAAFEAAAADSVADRVRRAMQIADAAARRRSRAGISSSPAASPPTGACARRWPPSPRARATRCTCLRRRCARTTPPWSPGPAPSGWRAAGPTASTSPRARAGRSIPTRRPALGFGRLGAKA